MTRQLPSRLRRLDGALADLPLEEPMLLTELDGFLTGIALCPEAIARAEWLRNVWGADEGDVAPFEDPRDVQWFADAVEARRDEIARDLARGKPQPLFDIDERNGEVFWEPWLDGFAEAMTLRPESWGRLADGDDGAGEALVRLDALIAIAMGQSELDSVAINAVDDRAPADIVAILRSLHAARVRNAPPPTAPAQPVPGTPGRNAPCLCGSGKKFKHCCA